MTKLISFRVSDEEYLQLKAKAKQERCSISTYVRNYLAGYLAGVQEQEELAERLEILEKYVDEIRDRLGDKW